MILQTKQAAKNVGEKYRFLAMQKDFSLSVLSGVLFFLGCVYANFLAETYALKHASNAVSDIVLSNIRVFDVDGIFIYGTFLFVALTGFLSFSEPRRIPFMLKSIGLFVFVRAVFMSLTHIGPYPAQLEITSALLNRFSLGGDLFFSGHTGMPFLVALIFWENIRLRILFIAASIFFGVLVLLAHLHYSIDVLAAFFITYAIYRMAEIFFKKDREFFRM